LIVLVLASLATARCGERLDALRRVQARESLVVLVTDSGLGGLSVNADIARRAEATKHYREIRLVFANALPGTTSGYNTMSSLEEKARVFSAALEGMTAVVKPDIILIACNTLSVVYPKTAFARTTKIPVVGIVEIGTEMMAQRLKADPRARLIIFGTETTVGEDAHRIALRARGIDDRRMAAQACPDLAGEIQADPGSDIVRTMIELSAGEAAGRFVRDTVRTYVGLCCTHYGYVADLFATAVRTATCGAVEIVNPNMRMAEVLFPEHAAGRFSETTVIERVISRAPLSREEIGSIARLLEPVSRGTADALRAAEIMPALFTVPE
jgi:glutamate racemase